MKSLIPNKNKQMGRKHDKTNLIYGQELRFFFNIEILGF